MEGEAFVIEKMRRAHQKKCIDCLRYVMKFEAKFLEAANLEDTRVIPMLPMMEHRVDDEQIFELLFGIVSMYEK